MIGKYAKIILVVMAGAPFGASPVMGQEWTIHMRKKDPGPGRSLAATAD